MKIKSILWQSYWCLLFCHQVSYSLMTEGMLHIFNSLKIVLVEHIDKSWKVIFILILRTQHGMSVKQLLAKCHIFNWSLRSITCVQFFVQLKTQRTGIYTHWKRQYSEHVTKIISHVWKCHMEIEHQQLQETHLNVGSQTNTQFKIEMLSKKVNKLIDPITKQNQHRSHI